jgi:hypothetical protein
MWRVSNAELGFVFHSIDLSQMTGCCSQPPQHQSSEHPSLDVLDTRNDVAHPAMSESTWIQRSGRLV